MADDLHAEIDELALKMERQIAENKAVLEEWEQPMPVEEVSVSTGMPDPDVEELFS